MINIWRMVGLVVALLTATTQAEEITVAVAANFYRPMQQLAQMFEQQTGHQVKLSAGSTGKLYAQIVSGAPFDVYIAADQKRPSALVKQQLASAQQTVAIGQLVLWSQDPLLIDGSPQQLQQASLSKLALASPKTAPYGAAAIEVLEKLNVLSKWQHKLIRGQNVSQTYQHISSGNVPMGFLALSQVYDQGQLQSGSAWLVPSSYHQPLKMDGVLLQRSQSPEAGLALLKFLASNQVKALIQSFGYQTISE